MRQWNHMHLGPVYPIVAIVVQEYVELVRCSLLAALEALHPSALFGLVSFSSKVGPCGTLAMPRNHVSRRPADRPIRD